MGSTFFAILLFSGLIVFLGLSIPVGFAMSGLSLVLGYFFWGGEAALSTYVTSMFASLQNITYTAVPLYIFMAGILRYSDLADDMYDVMYKWFGKIRGGLGAGTVVISALFAAMVGLTSVATATLGASALPSMLSRGYDKKFSAGIIMAGACIGIIIPPSVFMLIYSALTEVSPGKMFTAGIVPGLIITAVLIIYSLVICRIKPNYGPALPKEESFTMKEKLASLKGIILPILVICFVLVSIFTGICTPTEAASVGVIGALVAAKIKGSLNMKSFKNMIKMTVGLNAGILWMVISANAFARITSVTGIGTMIANFALNADISRWVFYILVCVIFAIIGMFMDASAALYMLAPILIPVFNAMGFDLLWFGIIFVLLVCLGSLTPPFGICLFVLRGVAPQLTMGEIYRSSVPYIIFYVGAIVFFTVFPGLSTWLPNLMG